ncbi:MAG: threonine dehydratase [Acidimicrobiaceae bacterium]
MRVVLPPTDAAMVAALAVVRHNLDVTPVLAGGAFVLKLETVQPTGSFKVRGALAAVSAALAADPTGHVVTSSAGNHGLGVAWAAARLGASATVVVPQTASAAKLEKLARFPIELVLAGTSYEEAEAAGLARAAEGARFVSPYNDPHVIAGQATIAGELRTQVPDLRRVVVPVGGGGLISGIALALAGTGIEVVGVEVERSAPMRAAYDAGVAVPITVGESLADGLAGNLEPGSVTIELVRAHVTDLVTVTEDEVAGAMRHMATEHGLIVEGSGAVGVAAVLAGHVAPVDGTTAVVVTGRNIDLRLLAEVLSGDR